MTDRAQGSSEIGLICWQFSLFSSCVCCLEISSGGGKKKKEKESVKQLYFNQESSGRFFRADERQTQHFAWKSLEMPSLHGEILGTIEYHREGRAPFMKTTAQEKSFFH